MNTNDAIRTDKLAKRFKGTEAVRGIDLCVPQGSVYALLGLNGAGKSTAIKMLLGLLRPDSGASSVLGRDPMKDAVAVRRQIGYVPEGPALYRWMSIKDFLWFVSGFYPSWDEAYAGELLARFNLDENKKIKALSKGMVAKLALTAALAHKPPLLVLDDPTMGLDVVVRREFLESIVTVIQEEGRTVFLSTHQIDEVERVADRVAILHEGAIVWQGAMNDLKESVKRVTLIVQNGFREPEGIPGILSREKSDRMWSAVVSGAGEERLRALRSLPGVTDLKTDHLTLEDIFCALVGGTP